VSHFCWFRNYATHGLLNANPVKYFDAVPTMRVVPSSDACAVNSPDLSLDAKTKQSRHNRVSISLDCPRVS
jgi:hypothetical protein